jgi:hypothetical protein
MAREVNMAIQVRFLRQAHLTLLITLLAVFPSPWPAMAQASANFYSTQASNGTENYAIIHNAGTVPVPQPVRLIAACNYNLSSAEVVMAFDASALPANGGVPKMQLPLPPASNGNAPSCGSFSLPAGGVTFYTGVVIVASTTGKVLTADTTNGGNMFFEVGY